MDHQIEIITTISEHERSSVFLAMDNSGNSGGVGKPVILKRISGCTLVPLFQRIQEIDSSYFPKIIEIKTENGKTEVLEEYIEGRELSRILSESSLTEAEAFSYMKQLLEAVRILHEMNPPLLHRDIKPENILITEGGQVRLLDFDAAREWNNDDRQSDTVLLGTRGYAAPEQFGYSQTDVRSDLYSVGIVCRQICEKIVLSGQKKQKLKSFCDRATMFDPEERFQSAKEMLEALKRIENGDGGNTVRRRHIKPVFAVIPFLIIAGILLAILIFHDKSESAYDLAVIPGDYIFRRIETRMTVMNEIDGVSTERYPGLLMQDK